MRGVWFSVEGVGVFNLNNILASTNGSTPPNMFTSGTFLRLMFCHSCSNHMPD